MNQSNIVLIGMPGSGKSTVGVILAKLLSKHFIDTDVLIQTEENRSLQEIADNDGHLELRKIEERVLTSLHNTNCVISTGGSAAYSHKAMTHLHKNGTLVFLDTDLATLRQRVHNFDTRGIAKRPDQTFEDLFQERFKLYTKYADITVQSSGHSQEEVCFFILKELGGPI